MDCSRNSCCTLSYKGDLHGQVVEQVAREQRIVALMNGGLAARRAAIAFAIAAALGACHRVLPTEASEARDPPVRAQAPAKAKAPEAPPAPRTAASSISPSDPLNDAVLTGRIKAALLSDPQLAGADISVNTEHGVVALTGTVKSQEQVAIASAHAQHEDGVMRIDNHLTTNPE